MSKTVDEKVVEMKFDNSHFEKNVQGTLSTLDKLKAKLNFGGAAKGFQEIENASKKVNLDGLANGIQTVQMKFSAMEVVGVTALANITNAAVDAAKNITMSLLGIPAMKAGFDEYQMTMNTVQTLVNSTGKNIDIVNQSLKELDEYADKTVYSTADMFNNIYKFTNAGVDLEDAKTAMIGIANATAYAGQGAQQASIAYYNLAQSMSMGYLTTIDFKSINLANIATKEFKERLAEAAVAAGTLQKVDDDLYSTGKKSYTLQALFTQGLSDQWATTEVMMDVFKQYGSEETAIGQKAWKAAQEVKTFSMALETLKAQAGTGWKDTWTILFGNLDQAKRVWTGLTNFIGHFVDVIDNWRNRILKIAMDNPLRAIFDKINNSEALKAFQEVTDKVKQTSKTLEEYQDMVWRIWRGDFNNQPYREALVEAEGYSYGVTQSLVNLTAKLDENGRGWRAISQITEDDVIAAEKEFGIEAEEVTETLTEQTEAIKELTDEQLKQIGLTDEEIKMYRQLEKAAKRYGISIEDIIKMMDKANGRDLLYGNDEKEIIGAFQHIGNVITQIIQSIKKAWTDVFDGITGVDLYMLIAKFQKFTESIENFLKEKDRLDKISRTFRGLFSAIHIVAQVITGPIKIAFQILKGILAGLNIPILDFTSMIGDMIYNLDRWLTENNMIVIAVQKLTEWIVSIAKATIEWAKSNEQIMNIVHKIREAFDAAKENVTSWFDRLKSAENIPQYIFEGLIKGIKEKGPNVWETIKAVAEGIIETIKNVLKIHSPSKVMIAIGGFIITGLIAGMQQQEMSLWEFIGGIGSKLIDFFQQLNVGDIIATGITTGILITANKALDILDRLSAPFQGLANALNGLSDLFTSTGKAVKQWGRAMEMQGLAALLKSFAISIGVLVAAIFILGKMPSDELEKGAHAVVQVVIIIGAALAAMAIMSKQLAEVNLLNMGKVFGLITSLVFGVIMLSIALKLVSSIDPDRMFSSIGGLLACVVMLGGLVAAMAFLEKKLQLGKDFGAIGLTMIEVAGSILMVAIALKMMNGVQWESIGKLTTVFTAISALLTYFMALNKASMGGLNGASRTILAASGALILLVFAMKLSGSLKSKDFANGIVVIGIFTAFLTALMAISRIFRETEMIKVGGSLLLVVVALGVMAVVMKMLGDMDPKVIKKGLKCISLMSGLIIALIAVSRNSSSLHGTTLIGVAVVIAAMAAAVWVLGLLDPERAAKGLTCVGILTFFVDSLILMAHGLQANKDVVKMLTTIAVIIALLAVAMVALSFIEPTKLASAAGALVLVINSMSGIILATSNMKSLDWKQILTLGGILAVIAVLSQIVYELSKIPNSDNAIKNAAALTILALASAGLAFALSKMNLKPDQWKEIGTGIVALTAMVVPFYAFGQALKSMNGVEANVEAVGILTALMYAMTPLLAAISGLAFAFDKFGKDGWTSIKAMGVGIGSLTGMVLPLLGFVQVLKNLEGVKVDQDAVNNLILLTSVITAISAVMLAIGLIIELSGGTAWVAMAVAIGTLTLMIIPLFAFLGVLGAMKDIPDAASNAEALADFAEKITGMLLQLSLVSPLLTAAVASITGLVVLIGVVGTLAVAVGELMEYVPNLKYFLDKGLDIFEEIAEKLGTILGKFIDSFATTATQNLGLIGTRLSEFAIGALPFIMVMQKVDDKVIKGAGSLAGAVIALSAANFIEAITRFYSGGVSFARLGSELSSFAINSSEFIKVMSDMNPDVASAAKAMSDAILALTASNALDSLTAWLTGGKDLASFSSNLGELGKGLRAFVTGLIGDEGTFGDDEIETVNCGANALSAIANVAGQIQATGGLLQSITGTVDIKGFADSLSGLGAGIRAFAMALIGDGSFGPDEIDTINCGADALGKIAEAAGKIASTGGVNEYFNGVKDIGAFASKLGDVGQSIRGFVYEIVKDNIITKDAQPAIEMVLNIITSMAGLGDIDINKAVDGLEKLGKKLGEVGKNVADFVSKFSEIKEDQLKAAKEKLDTIIELAKKIADLDHEALNKVSETLKKLGNDSIKEFIKGLNNEGQPKSDAEKIVVGIIDAMKSKAEAMKKDIEDSAKTTATYATDALYGEEIQKKVSESGTNFVQGFANALKDTDNRVYNAAYKIGERAVTAINTATDTHSPSRETYKTGKFFDLGFINGIKEYSNNVYRESYSIGDEAKKGLTNAVSKVASIMNSEMDTSPTIRPVLDLSDIENGVGTLDSMFASPSVGVMSNLNAISSGISANGQNSGEIVNAINKLRKDLGSVTSNTYNINGVTYDDGSEIQEAVGTLVRAARIERRM